MPKYHAWLWKNSTEISPSQIDLIHKIKSRVSDLRANYETLIQFDKKQITGAFELDDYTVVGMDNSWQIWNFSIPREEIETNKDNKTYATLGMIEAWISPIIDSTYQIIKIQNKTDQFIGITYNAWNTKMNVITERTPELTAFTWANQQIGTQSGKKSTKSRFHRIVSP